VILEIKRPEARGWNGTTLGPVRPYACLLPVANEKIIGFPPELSSSDTRLLLYGVSL